MSDDGKEDDLIRQLGSKRPKAGGHTGEFSMRPTAENMFEQPVMSPPKPNKPPKPEEKD